MTEKSSRFMTEYKKSLTEKRFQLVTVQNRYVGEKGPVIDITDP